MKQLHSERYKGFDIIIEGRFIQDYYDWHEKDTSAVRLIFTIFTPKGNVLNQHDDSITVAKKQPYKFLFWTIKPKITFEQQVKDKLEDLIEYIREKIDTRLYEEKITDGLLDSLKEIQ